MERMASLHRSHLFISFSENKVLFESANAFAACLIFHLVPPPFFFFFLLSASSAALYRSVSVSPFWLVEDVSNLTASDVMNRVNLGYLQGNSCACVCV